MGGKFGSVLFLLVILSFVSGDETPPECNLPAEAGRCYAYFEMFFYDASSGKCQGFIYGGCGGNDNRFWTEKECMDHCGGGGGGGGGGRQETNEICNLEKDGGNCDSYLHRYYFDKDTGKCERFVYTGCGGNDNNFGYDFECERYCPGDLDLGDICSLEPEPGMCMAAFRRYYFNSTSGQCEEFIFGGCQGNYNNFDTVGECESFCPSRK